MDKTEVCPDSALHYILYQGPGQECAHLGCSRALVYPLANAVSTPPLVLPLVQPVNQLTELRCRTIGTLRSDGHVLGCSN